MDFIIIFLIIVINFIFQSTVLPSLGIFGGSAKYGDYNCSFSSLN